MSGNGGLFGTEGTPELRLVRPGLFPTVGAGNFGKFSNFVSKFEGGSGACGGAGISGSWDSP